MEHRTDLVVLIVPRYARCNRLQDLRRVSKTLHIYRLQDNQPLVEVDLYDAKAEMFGELCDENRDVLLVIIPCCCLWSDVVSACTSTFDSDMGME